MRSMIKSRFQDAGSALHKFTAAEDNIKTVESIANLLAETFRKGSKVIIFGNGGSMCDAMHFAEELTGKFRNDRPPLPAIAISDPSHLTCVANDYGFEEVFARGVSAYAKANDVVIGISTSGNSPNVIKAMQTAHNLNCFTVALLGREGGKLKGECDFELIIPAETSDRIQEVHIKVLHVLIELIEVILFPDK